MEAQGVELEKNFEPIGMALQKPLIPILPAYRLGDLVEALGAKMHVTGLPSWEKRHESMDFGNSSDAARRLSVNDLRSILYG